MEEKAKIQQKPITHFLQEMDVSSEVREKVLFAISKLVHERNEEVFHAQDEEDAEKREELFKSVEETDKMIRDKINHIKENKDHDESCTDCFTY